MDSHNVPRYVLTTTHWCGIARPMYFVGLLHDGMQCRYAQSENARDAMTFSWDVAQTAQRSLARLGYRFNVCAI